MTAAVDAPVGTAPETAVKVSLSGVSKSFAATQALTDVSLDLRAGEVHALVGENGAGKSTLVKILAGVHQPDTGTIRVDGEPTVIAGPAQARALGIAVVHQEPRLFPDLSVAENVYIGHAPAGPLRTVDWGEMRSQAKALFEQLDVRFDVQAPVRGLSMADQQLIEIAKALSVEAGVLILDEPTASLSAHEVERLFTIVRGLRDRGVAVLFVSHRLDEVFELCDRATVLRDGKHVVTAPTSEHDDRGSRPAHGRPGGLAVPEGRDPDRRRAARGRGPRPRRHVPRTSRSPSARARSSDWPASSARGARRSPGCCSASTTRDAGEIRLRRHARQLREPVRGDGRGRRLRARGSPSGRAGARLLDRRRT